VPIDHFKALAGLFDRMGEFILAEEFIQSLVPEPGGRLLDAGGGTGRVSSALRNFVSKVIIADPSAQMLGYAQRKGLETVCASAEHLPFLQESFERVIMVDAFHHVMDQRQTAKELWRVLAPSGRLLIVEPDLHKFSTKLLALGEKILLMRSHFQSYEKIMSFFDQKQAKLEVVQFNKDVIIIVKKDKQL